MKRLFHVIAVMALLLLGTVSPGKADLTSDFSSHGDVVLPSNWGTVVIVINPLDFSLHVMIDYSVNQITFDDGYVTPLDTSDGSNYHLQVDLFGSLRIVDRIKGLTLVQQWVADAD